jgi:hypothetical protein
MPFAKKNCAGSKMHCAAQESQEQAENKVFCIKIKKDEFLVFEGYLVGKTCALLRVLFVLVVSLETCSTPSR